MEKKKYLKLDMKYKRDESPYILARFINISKEEMLEIKQKNKYAIKRWILKRYLNPNKNAINSNLIQGSRL